MESNKPLVCTIENWWVEDVDCDSLIPNKRKVYIIRGYGFYHPKFGLCGWFHTSQVITPKSKLKEGATIETLNSQYILGKVRKND